MKKTEQRRIIKNIISIACVIAMWITNNERIYAMEAMKEQIAEKTGWAEAREYEMNIVLEDLFIKRWERRGYAPDEWDDSAVIDAPLGEYSGEKLKEYTDEDFHVEFEYCYGYYGAGKAPHLIQIERIYKGEELYLFCYNVWTGYAVNNVVEDGRLFCMDMDDYQIRGENYYESIK